jgi:hypothetical protein
MKNIAFHYVPGWICELRKLWRGKNVCLFVCLFFPRLHEFMYLKSLLFFTVQNSKFHFDICISTLFTTFIEWFQSHWQLMSKSQVSLDNMITMLVTHCLGPGGLTDWVLPCLRIKAQARWLLSLFQEPGTASKARTFWPFPTPKPIHWEKLEQRSHADEMEADLCRVMWPIHINMPISQCVSCEDDLNHMD